MIKKNQRNFLFYLSLFTEFENFEFLFQFHNLGRIRGGKNRRP